LCDWDSDRGLRQQDFLEAVDQIRICQQFMVFCKSRYGVSFLAGYAEGWEKEIPVVISGKLDPDAAFGSGEISLRRLLQFIWSPFLKRKLFASGMCMWEGNSTRYVLTPTLAHKIRIRVT